MIPACYNRPPRPDGYTRYGLDQLTGQFISVYLSNAWSPDRCATWDGVGIGPPTEEWPHGTPYPVAHGWDCEGCVWLPEHSGLPQSDPSLTYSLLMQAAAAQRRAIGAESNIAAEIDALAREAVALNLPSNVDGS